MSNAAEQDARQLEMRARRKVTRRLNRRLSSLLKHPHGKSYEWHLLDGFVWRQVSALNEPFVEALVNDAGHLLHVVVEHRSASTYRNPFPVSRISFHIEGVWVSSRADYLKYVVKA